MIVRAILHMLLHFLVPAVVARRFYGTMIFRAWLIMMAAMLIDLDHLFAEPVYDPGRCSIGFHPLHQYWLIGVYALMMLWPKSRLIGLGLTIHMALDGVDCIWMQYEF